MQKFGDDFIVDFDEVFASLNAGGEECEGNFSDCHAPDNKILDACGEQVGSFVEEDTQVVARGELESNLEIMFKQGVAGQLEDGGFPEEMAARGVDHFDFFADSPAPSPTWQNLTSPLSSGPDASQTLAGFADCTSYSPLSAFPDSSDPPPAPFSLCAASEVDCNFLDSFPPDAPHGIPSFWESSDPRTPNHGRIGSFHISVPYPPRLPQRNPYSATRFPSLNRSLSGRSPASTRMLEAWAASGRTNPYESAERSPRGRMGRRIDRGSCNRTVEQEWLEKFQLRAPVTTPRGRQAKLCDSCVLNRQIIHSNGVQDTRLELHWQAIAGGSGGGGNCHAVLHTRGSGDTGSEQALQQQIIKIPGGDVEFVQSFLRQYMLLREKERFFCCYDSSPSEEEGAPLGLDLGAYNARDCAQRPPKVAKLDHRTSLCAQDPSPSFHPSTLLFPSGRKGSSESELIDGMLSQPPQPACQLVLQEKSPPAKTSAAAQRERTGKLRVCDLAVHFHLPISLAAKELGICPTVLKKICRRNNMRRWPHRKIKSIERIITTLEETLAEGVTSGEATICKEIAQLQHEKDLLCAGVLGDL